ncbi:MAG: LamG-like jellyroll fold domain-containing protein [Bacteroidota bacterium]
MKPFFQQGLVALFLITFSAKSQTSFCGCTNPIACNYDPLATCDDGSCVFNPTSSLPDSISLCEGEEALLNPMSNAFDFLWSTGSNTNSITVSEPGTYSVELTNSVAFPPNGILPGYLPSEGLLGWYPFNNDVIDEGPLNNNPTNNGATFSEDRFGNLSSCADLNGASRILFDEDFDLDFAERSLSIWFYPRVTNSSNFQLIFTNDNPELENGNVKFALIQDQLFATDGLASTLLLDNIQADTWYHGAIVRSDSSYLYINGELIRTDSLGTFKSAGPTVAPRIILGSARTNDRYFNGLIDDMVLYDRALSPQEVMNLFNASPNAFCTVIDSTVVVDADLDDDGLCDDVDPCPSSSLNPGDVCDDGNPNTQLDVVQADCTCQGEQICANPFPAVEATSLSTTPQGIGFLTSWDAVPGQIGCQIAARFANGNNLGSLTIGGANASSFFIPGQVLQPNTDYEWRVRCGCSQAPIVAGPWSAWQPFSTAAGAIISVSPNPSNGITQVNISVSQLQNSTLEVIDMNGRLVEQLFTGTTDPNSEYRFDFDGSDLPVGIYICRMITSSEIVTEKLIIRR